MGSCSMSLIEKLLLYKRALHLWRAARSFMTKVDCRSGEDQEPNPENYGLKTNREKQAAESLREEVLHGDEED